MKKGASNFNSNVKRLIYMVSNRYELIDTGVYRFEAWLIGRHCINIDEKFKYFTANRAIMILSDNFLTLVSDLFKDRNNISFFQSLETFPLSMKHLKNFDSLQSFNIQILII